MRPSTLLCLTAVAVAVLLPAVTAVQARIITDVISPRGESIQKGAAADPNCTTGVHNPSAAYPSVCCKKKCGSTCGASSCYGDCCTGSLAKSAPSCDVSAPPCIITNKACDPSVRWYDPPMATECASLVNFYASTNGNKWTNNTGWLSGSSYCGWNWLDFFGDTHGVICDSSGNVKVM